MNSQLREDSQSEDALGMGESRVEKFLKFQAAMASSPVMRLPSFDYQFIVATEASNDTVVLP